ncbi:Fic family protein [Rhizobium sp. PL01]|uniref:Fic family protein n=1 Tax=Rhizobium sp. PL01 TaxID=3085631 RepID=UPI002981CD2A|nr:Fic family protein [Rhizobium sp. PL01]MDW5315894.1 Fic family protein [Rhizobium sp. PL01]
METIFSAYEAISLSANHIRQFHRDLLAHSTKEERHRGAYKTLSNNVEAFNEQEESLGMVFEMASPFDTPRRMKELIAWLDEQGREKRLHPLLVVAIFVVVFLEIHPFQDGNGRLSRILTTLLLLRGGYAYVPYSSLESIIEQSKESYYISLRRTQGTIRSAEPDWNPWIEFFLRALHRQNTRLEKKMERERIILADMPALSVTLLELAREHGRITVGEAARSTDASRHTIKDHLKALVDQGYLVLQGAGRGAWYGLS